MPPEVTSSVLAELLEILATPPCGGITGRADVGRSVDVLRGWHDALGRAAPGLTVAVVGEFNAGKSTLVNALVGRPVAFVDTFEATTVTATYVHDAEEFADVTYEDGSRRRFQVGEFVEACKSGMIGGARSAEVHVRHGLPYRLVDTSGLGTSNERNERLAERAIMEADVLVWVIDADDVLGAQEGAFLRRCRETGFPLVVALGKADTFAAVELEAALADLARRLGSGGPQLVPVAPARHSESAPDAGVVRLAQLLDDLAGSAARARDRARRAKLREAGDEARRVLAALDVHLGTEVERMEAERQDLQAQARAIAVEVAAACERRIAEEFRAALPHDFPDPLRAGDLDRLCELAVAQFTALSDRCKTWVPDLVRERAKSGWQTFFANQTRDIERQIVSVRARGEEPGEDLDFLRRKLDGIALRHTHVIASSDAGARELIGALAAGLLSIWIRDPRPILEFLRCVGLRQPSRSSTTVEEIVYPLSECIRLLCSELVPERVGASLTPHIRSYLSDVVDRALDAICERRVGGPNELLKVTASRVRQLRATLATDPPAAIPAN